MIPGGEVFVHKNGMRGLLECDAEGKEVESQEQKAAWSRMLEFTVDPGERKGTLTIEVLSMKEK